MKHIKIDYQPFFGGGLHDNEFFSCDENYIDVKSFYELEDKNHVFAKCPAWKHWASSAFIVYSQADIVFFVNKDSKQIGSNYLSPQELNYWIQFNAENDAWLDGKNPVIQIGQMMCLDTKEKNVWVEQLPSFEKSSDSNYEIVPAAFPISVWKRPLSVAIKISDPNKPVVIRRGDPLYIMKFNTGNFSTFSLNKKQLGDNYKNELMSNMNWVKQNPMKSWSKIIGLFNNQKNESKCPFSFLFRK